MRLVHFADVHIGAEAYGQVDPQTGVSSRLGDFLSALDWMVDYTLSHDVDLVLFAGDAYRSREPSPTHQREFAKRILKLVRTGVPVVLLAGNHDLPQVPARASSVDIFATLQVEGVHVARRIATHRIETRHGPVQVVTLPWATRSMFLTQDECRGKTMQQVDDDLLATIDRLLKAEIDHLDATLPRILLAHAHVVGAVLGSERSTMLGSMLNVPQSALADPAFDYVALGHIHKHQVLRDEPPMVYAGSMERVDFGEENEPKGFVAIELDAGRCRFEFVPVPARPFVTVRVDAQGSDPTREVLSAIEHQPIEGAIVRVLVKVPEAQAPLLDMRAIRKALEPAFHVASLTPEVVRETRLRLGAHSVEELTPLEMLGRYLDVKHTPDARKERLVTLAGQLIETLDE